MSNIYIKSGTNAPADITQRIIDLGQFSMNINNGSDSTTVDIIASWDVKSKINNYSKLTTNNFIATWGEINIMWLANGGSHGNIEISNSSISYNNSTGVLTLTGKMFKNNNFGWNSKAIARAWCVL